MELVRFELRIPKELREMIRIETAKQQSKGIKAGNRISGQYLLPIAALETFLSMPEDDRDRHYRKAAETIGTN